jgi:hypothetical protein
MKGKAQKGFFDSLECDFFLVTTQLFILIIEVWTVEVLLLVFFFFGINLNRDTLSVCQSLFLLIFELMYCFFFFFFSFFL